jgi:two-component sensor histidine kinase
VRGRVAGGDVADAANDLNHRVKDTLATMQSIAAQTLRSGKDSRESSGISKAA